jgi:hypothetical protein
MKRANDGNAGDGHRSTAVRLWREALLFDMATSNALPELVTLPSKWVPRSADGYVFPNRDQSMNHR